jgi:thiamine-phosphate pyrophosphorylase
VIPRLWYVTDGARASGARPLADVIAAAARGGVEAVLLRERTLDARELAALCCALAPLRAAGLRVLASRRLDLALALGLDGVQLTADGIPVADARAWLARVAASHLLLGYSAHSRAEAAEVAAQGADYAMLSPLFATDSKPGAPPFGLEELGHACRGIPIPVVALGGLTAERAADALRAGAHGVAAASGIGAAADVEGAARDFRRRVAEARAATGAG